MIFDEVDAEMTRLKTTLTINDVDVYDVDDNDDDVDDRVEDRHYR